MPEIIGCPDAGRRNFFLFLFRLQTVKNSKFSASGLWLRTDRCLMPWRFWQALCSGTGRHLLGLPGFVWRQTVSPKSWLRGKKLRISNCSTESQKKEKVSPPGWYWLNFLYLSGCWFSDVCGVTEKGKSFSARRPGSLYFPAHHFFIDSQILPSAFAVPLQSLY